MAKKKQDTPRNFAHDSNTRNCSDVIRLRMAHGAAGYGIYLMILEILREAPDYVCPLDFKVLAFDLKESEDLICKVISDFNLFSFTPDGKGFYSPMLSSRLHAQFKSVEVSVTSDVSGCAEPSEPLTLVPKADFSYFCGMKLVVFDFDGTLADTNEAIVRTFKAAAAANGLECAPDREIELSIGQHLREMFSNLCGADDPQLNRRCIESYLKIFKENHSYIKLFPGVKETLERLRKEKVYISIATNRGEDSLLPLMKMLGINDLIDGYATPEFVENVKPAPDMARLLMKQFGVTPDETLVVGDTTYDMDMGNSAGCYTCAVTYGSHPAERLAMSKPMRMIDSMTDLRHSEQ